MHHHPPRSGRPPVVTAARVVMLVMALVLSGCKRSSESTGTVAPVASTIDISEPVVVVEDDPTSDSDATLTVSEAVPGDGAQTAEEQYVVADDIITLPPEQVDDLLGDGSTPSTSSPTSNDPSTTVTATTLPASEGSVTSPGSTTTPTTTPAVPPDVSNPSDDPEAIEIGPVGPVGQDDATSPDKPLQVLKYGPEGEVQIAPYVTVTFNQPMAGAAASSSDLPITIEPATNGSWRWLGDRTARFEPADAPDQRLPRFAAATLFRITVAAEIESVSGKKLGTDLSWQFATPPPTVVDVIGASTSADDAPQVDTTPVFVVQADQHIGATEVSAVTTVTADGAPVEMRPATNAEIEAHPVAADAVAAAGGPRTAAITPVDELPPAADVNIEVGPNLTSLEGGLVQPEAVTYFARTRNTPQVVASECIPDDCAAGSSLSIVLNSALDTSDQTRADLAELITVSPQIPNLEINVLANRITLVGDTRAGTDYTVTVGKGLRDVFGQSIAVPLEARFSVGDAHPLFDGPRSEMVILDPDAARPTLAVQTVNHQRLQVGVWAVTTRDFTDYQTLRTNGAGADAEIPETWIELFDDTINVTGPPNEIVTTEIDLDDELAQAGSQVVVFVAPVEGAVPDQFVSQNQPLWTWVQRTALGVDAIADESTLMIWTTDLRTGKPVGGIPVALIGDSRVATTDEDGIRVIKLTDDPIAGLIANDGSTVTYLPAPESPGWKISDATQQSRWQVVLDGTVYRAGETVRLTGWIRGLDPQSDRLLITPDEETDVVYTVVDAAGREVASGTTTTNQRGGFSAQIPLPSDVELGEARIVLRSGTSSTTTPFEVSRFLAPEFSVRLQPTVAGPYVARAAIDLAATATYTNRSPVTNAETAWSVEVNPTSYKPAGWAQYHFGRDPSSGVATETTSPSTAPNASNGQDSAKHFAGTTDGTGSHAVSVAVDEADGFPSIVTATAMVTDDQGPAEANASVLIHPAEQYVGVRTAQLFTELGEPIVVEAVVTDVDGAPRSGRPVEVNLFRVLSEWENGEWVRTLDSVDVCGFDSTASTKPMRCTFTTDTGGEYLIRATVRDEEGRGSVTERTHWVSGALALPSSPTQLEQATVVPDREQYKPGDTARLLIGAPWAPARGVVVLSRYNIEETIPFETEDGSVIVEVPITDRSIPNVTGWVTMIGAAPRLDANGRVVPGETRPAVASGRINLSVPATSQTLDVSVRPETTTLRPGQDSTITVGVTDKDGEPVADAQVAVIVADEAALAASDFHTGDPTALFYADYPGQVSGISSRQYVQLLDTRLVDPNPEVAAIEQDSTTSAADERAAAESAAATEVVAEDRFSPLALYSTDNFTDEKGSAEVSFRVPDRSSQYRISAVVVGPGQHFGFDESSIAAGQPLDVQLEPPVLLRLGDQMELPVLLRNHTDQPLQVVVAAAASGAKLTGPAGQQVTVDAESIVELRFPLRGTETGPAAIRLVAESAPVSDGTTDTAGNDAGSATALRSEVSATIPVVAPATAMRFATNATLEPGPAERLATQRIIVPADTATDFGGLRLTASTTVLSMAAEVAREQADSTPVISNSARAYQITAALSLGDRPEAFASDDPTPANAIVQSARRSFQLLTAAQREDGAWSDWPRAADPDPWVTVVAADAVVSGLAQEWGQIPDDARAAMLAYVANIGAHIPDAYPDASRNLTRAYAVRVLRRAGGDSTDVARSRADELFDAAGDSLAPDALALIWPSVTGEDRIAQVGQMIAERAVSDDDGVRFAADYDTADFRIDWSQSRTDALVLDALVAMAPESELVQPALGALLADRVTGTWGNAPANAYAAVALRSFSDRFEPVVDGSVATFQARIGSNTVLDDQLTGLATAAATVPLADIVGTNPMIEMYYNGTARLYIDSQLTYAPVGRSDRQSGFAEPIDRGIVVERSYEPILNPDDVAQQADGSWVIKRGAPVRVRVVMVTDSPRTNVTLIDQLPAGLTPASPSLAVAQSRQGGDASADPSQFASAGDYAKWRGWNWFDHQTLTDRSAEVVTASLGAGSYEYIYVARALTPGRFIAPPATANATYDPDVSGSSRAAPVVVE